MTRDWVEWHRAYDDPSSSLSRRRAVVQDCLRQALGSGDVRRLISMCAGDGGDVLPVLAARPVSACLVELDPALAERARVSAASLADVEVRVADAGLSRSYVGAAPAEIVLACGVFGNLTPEDVRRTIEFLPALLATNGVVIWTRGRGDSGPDPSLDVRREFAAAGFRELAYVAPADARFRVGMHRLDAPPAVLRAGLRVFRFV